MEAFGLVNLLTHKNHKTVIPKKSLKIVQAWFRRASCHWNTRRKKHPFYILIIEVKELFNIPTFNWTNHKSRWFHWCMKSLSKNACCKTLWYFKRIQLLFALDSRDKIIHRQCENITKFNLKYKLAKQVIFSC